MEWLKNFFYYCSAQNLVLFHSRCTWSKILLMLDCVESNYQNLSSNTKFPSYELKKHKEAHMIVITDIRSEISEKQQFN